MLSQRLANIAFSALVLAVSAYLAWVAQGFEAAGLLASSGLPAKFFPQLMLACMGICAVIVLATYMTKGRAHEGEAEFVYGEPMDAVRGLSVLAVTVIGYVIWQTWGYVPMIVFLGPACCAAMGVRSPIIYAVVLALAGIIYLIFSQLLGTQFHV